MFGLLKQTCIVRFIIDKLQLDMIYMLILIEIENMKTNTLQQSLNLDIINKMRHPKFLIELYHFLAFRDNIT